MRLGTYIALACVVAGLSCGTSQAANLLLENFNSPTGQNQNANQTTTGFPVAFGGSYAGWTATGTSAVHMVNRNGSGNWAPMLWSAFSAPTANVITSPSVAAGNAAAQLYSVSFDLAPANYATSQGTVAGDGVLVEVLNSSNAVIASRTYFPGSFASQASAGNLPYQANTLYYSGTGAGSGAAALRFSPTSTSFGTQRFAASVDNVGLNTHASISSGTVLFSENFNDATGQNFNATQATTGFPVAFGGNLANWTKAGDGAVHFVDRGSGNLAAMFFDGQPNNNVITTGSIGAGNLAGVPYAISFDLSAATYNNPAQNTTAIDGIVVEVLDSANNIIDTETFLPGTFASKAGPGSLLFQNVNMLYTGTGFGDGTVKLRLFANNPGSQRFGASIDNLQLTVLPEPGSLTVVAVMCLVGLLAIKPLARLRKTR
jgi:hypothetical protein